MARYSDILCINELELNIHLGEHAEERANKQRVLLTSKFFYEDSPSVTKKDDGTFLCYDTLSQHLHGFVAVQEFRFIEHLVHALFEEVQHYCDSILLNEFKPYIWMKIDKIEIPVNYAIGSASFIHTNLPEGAAVHG